MAINAVFNYERVKQIGYELLQAIGEDPEREGLKETPRRFASAWQEFIEYDSGNHETVFDSVTIDQMVLIKGMKVWSLCEHHLLPFYCSLSVGYIASDKILGLSKFGRIAQKFAHRLQVQERLVEQVARAVQEITGSENVAVIGRGEHLCMTMRGVVMPAEMISSAMYGVFRTKNEARAEFLQLVK
jgi:GTP cyclohydrolase I